MNWSSWSDFVAMGGYGLYVWGSFAMCALVLLIEVGLLSARRRAALRADEMLAPEDRGVGA
ncbi:MAG: heme exporter protein CcmD [Burkholderiaceae bacterium]